MGVKWGFNLRQSGRGRSFIFVDNTVWFVMVLISLNTVFAHTPFKKKTSLGTSDMVYSDTLHSCSPVTDKTDHCLQFSTLSNECH